jgi:hypothetical protein
MNDFAGLMRRLMADQGIGVRALARAIPCDHALVSRLLSGQQFPSAAMARRIDETLQADGRLATAADAVDWEASIRSGEVTVPGPVIVRGFSQVTSADLNTDRSHSTFSAESAATRAGGALDAWGTAHATNTNWPPVKVLTARQIGLAELEELEAAADEFRRWGHQFGGGIRRKAVVGQLSEVADILSEPHPQVLRCRLFAVASKLALVAGHMSADSSQAAAGTTYRYFTLALDAARESGDERLAVRVVNATARQLVSDGHPAEATALAGKGLRALRVICHELGTTC